MRMNALAMPLIKLRALEEEKNLHYSNVEGNVNPTAKANDLQGHFFIFDADEIVSAVNPLWWASECWESVEAVSFQVIPVSVELK
nr:hypothetical protein [Tanacetum cinerariifolium]